MPDPGLTRTRRRVPDSDATVVLRAPPAVPARRGRGRWVVVGTAAVLLFVALVVWGLWPRPAPVAPVVAHRAAPPAASPPAPTFPIVSADEATIRDHVAQTLTIFRFTPDPQIIVLDFPTLREQGEMLNRVAALVEKAGLPRDRVLDDAALAAAIKAGGDTPDTYYFGHDYAAAALVRFFALADAGGIRLNVEEQKLRALLHQLGWFAPGAVGGLISIPRVPQDEVAALDTAARATILHHELSHGLFFSDPAYAGYVRQFWLTTLSEGERASVRHFLGSEGYDTTDEELMYNEMQAYLMFTADPRFCQAANLGMTTARRQELAAEFLRGMPPGWLHDALANGRGALR